MKSLATYEREQEQTGRATETAFSRRAELVANWIVTDPDREIGEPLDDLFSDVEFRTCMQRLVASHGRGHEAVLLETARRLRDLFQQYADSYVGERLVEEEAQRLMEAGDEARAGVL